MSELGAASAHVPSEPEKIDSGDSARPTFFRRALGAANDFANHQVVKLMTASEGLQNSERLKAYSALGALAIATKFIEFRYPVFTSHLPQPAETLVRSGSHGIVGLVGADLAMRSGFANNRAGIGMSVLAVDYATEAAQALVFTKGWHHGTWHDTAAFTKENQWHWENSRDLAVAEVTGALWYERTHRTDKPASGE